MICPKCGKEIETNFCPFCGFEFTKENIGQIIENHNESTKNIFDTYINIAPFNPHGRIGRLAYITTLLITVFVFVVVSLFIKFLAIPTTIAALCVTIFATSKRLRDIGWSQWLLLLFFIPILRLFWCIPLFTIPSKQETISKISIEKYNKIQRNCTITPLILSFICIFATTKTLNFQIKYHLSSNLIKNSVIKNISTNIDLSNNDALIDCFLKTNLFTRKNQDTLIDKYGTTYKFECIDTCNILADVNGDKKPNLLTNVSFIRDQYIMTVEKNKHKNSFSNVNYFTDAIGYIHVFID